MGPIQTLSEFLNLLFRRRLLIGAVTVFGMVMALLYAASKPDVFESAAVIQVQGPRVSEPDAPQAASGSAQRLQAIEQQLTTRENMLAVIERHGLYAGLPLSDDEKVHLLRLAVRFQPVASVAAQGYGAPAQVSALIVFAQADTRANAARVANDFAQSLLDASVQGQTGRAREAVVFFRNEETRLRGEIRTVEAQIATFNSENRDALPDRRAQQQDEIAGIETEIRALDQQLVGLEAEAAPLRALANPRVTQARQLDTLSTQLATLGLQRAALEGQRQRLQAGLARVPEVERVLAGFERSLDQLQAQFEVATRRAAEADTAQKLEDARQGENFTLLERAMEPDYPVSGGRRKLAAVGTVASLILAVGIAFLLDLLHPVLRTRAQLERELDLVAVVAIPELSQLKGTGPSGWLYRAADWLAERGRPRLPGLPAGSPALTESGVPRPYAIAGGAAVILLLVAAAALT